jgi:hypothetical protein
LLRARGETAAADQLRAGPLEDAIVALRAAGLSDDAIAARLNTIFTTEDERVANALVLAEVLVPILVERLGSRIAAAAATHTPSAPSSQPSRSANRAAADVPPAGGIADFIDQMIAQEQPQPTQRRAS